MNRPTRRLALSLFVAFGMLLGAVTWYQVLAVDRYRNDPRNTRTSLSESGKERGVIVTRDGVVLARSEPNPEEPTSYDRIYPEGEVFAPVVGYTSLLAGSVGIERTFADELRSRRDFTISDLIAAALGGDLRPRSVQVSLDPSLQRRAYELLDGQRGAVVALDPSTGEILAYVSVPSYDPNRLTGPEAIEVRQELLDDPLTPLIDRAGNSLYAPGSTFKTIVAAAAIESGFASPETEFPDVSEFVLPGSTATIANFGDRLCLDGSTVTLQIAFVKSCNTVFADLAIQLGSQPIAATATAFGFDRGFDLPWTTAESTFPEDSLRNDEAALGQSGIGERDVRATPLQMAVVAAAIANQGEVMRPYVVRQVFNADGVTERVFDPVVENRALSPAAAAVMTDMMERVVTNGTGGRASVPGVRVAGKTGTAQGTGGAPEAWFIGFAPVDNPTIAIAVLVEDGGGSGEDGTGGSVAAPIAGELMSLWLAR